MSTAIATLVENQNRFSDLLEQHQGIVTRIAATYCWHREDREELSQEIITQLWRSFSTYDDGQRFSTWMYRVALNVAISWVRKHSLRQRHIVTIGSTIEEVSDSAEVADEDGRLEFLRTFINALDPLNRALMLLYLDERSYRETAEILGITETNVATKIGRLKQRIRKHSAGIGIEGVTDGTG